MRPRAGLLIAAAALLTLTPLAAGAPKEVLLGLPRSEAGLAAFARAVSDPGSPHYRDYASVATLRARFGAQPRTTRRARAALARRGIPSSLDPTGTFLIARVGARGAATLLGPGARAHAWAGGVTPADLPRDLRGLVTEVVWPGAGAPAAHARPGGAPVRDSHEVRLPARTGTPAGCDAGRDVRPQQDAVANPATRAFTPGQIRTAFGLGPLSRRTGGGRGAHIALFEIEGGVAPADVREFARCFGLPVPRVRSFAVDQRAPVRAAEGEATAEATLDVQAVMVAAPRARIDLVQAAYPETPWVRILSGALDAGRLGGVPDVVSISYAVCERQWALVDGGAQSRRLFDHVARIAGAAGVTVVVGSGDSGSTPCAHEALIPWPPGADRPGDTLAQLAQSIGTGASYPSSSPAVTAVGGLAMTLDSRNRIASARPWNDVAYGLEPAVVTDAGGTRFLGFPHGAGGGGVSALYARPAYQAATGVRAGGRTVPDVSLYADFIPGVAYRCSVPGVCPVDPRTGSPWTPGGGTSYATPLLATAVALVNLRERARGAPPLGFLNPLLYDPLTRRAGALRDVTAGSNAVLPVGCCAARRGYDLATGWGALDAGGLARAAARTWTAPGDR